ncbi:hypothetical protein GGD83_000550 [Rhodoblastus sphagnicola]|uniref:hypothetical protein n=1 Tax=Rhodoblastus sphagnicola TaxID=333368 RepID=UPI001304F3DA|nr:hypothetical protein [Rhodoblastus sphagnicola]MBB4196773.1 hypothetical protein [Rhodoblastus sphagnicola]
MFGFGLTDDQTFRLATFGPTPAGPSAQRANRRRKIHAFRFDSLLQKAANGKKFGFAEACIRDSRLKELRSPTQVQSCGPFQKNCFWIIWTHWIVSRAFVAAKFVFWPGSMQISCETETRAAE